MLNFIKNVLPPWTKKLWAWALKWIGIPLLASVISIVVINRLLKIFTGPDAYVVYLVGDFSDRNLKKLKEAFEEGPKVNLEIDDIEIKIRSLDAKEKDAQSVSARLAKAKDTLLVVGHLNSTASANALPNYLNADPPVPVILAVETNPELLPPNPKSTYYPVFRLSPTDDQQAEKAAEFAVENGAKAIWVVEDEKMNSVYSRYLAEEFISQVHRKSQLHEKRQAQAYEKRQHNRKRQAYEKETSKVLLWTTNLELPSPDTVKALGIDWVFFAGSPSSCLILTRQVKEIWKDQPIRIKPKILLGSSCANLDLLHQGGDDIKEAFLTHPMLASVFNAQGFEYRGKQASELLQKLIKDTGNNFGELSSKNGGIRYYVRWILNYHSVADARNALRAFMEQAVAQTSFSLLKQPYTFNRNGTAKETAFHVWQVETAGNEKTFADLGE